ncbi:MAG: hypothetical protein N2053_05360, partial [Chitinispirillaceae bacterium]|nr:hypothetical protein [Chitinispirillaceae bacterium]
SFYYVKILDSNTDTEKRILWICLGIFLTFMGINKQLDLQLLLAILGRYIGEKYGFLGVRRTLQSYFAITLFLLVLAITGIIIYRIRKILKNSLIELIGITFIITFFLIQTASMTHLKIVIKFEEINIPHIHALELLGVIIILFSLLSQINRQKQKQRIY